MPSQQLPALTAWETMEVGLIAFPRQPIPTNHDWWRELTGGADCTTTTKRFERTDEGVYQGRALSFISDPLRLTWKISTAFDPTSDTALSRPPTAGPFVEVREWFVELMARWLPQCPPIGRLAFVGRLVLPTTTREESYDLLGHYLKAVQVDRDSREFQYRINRPRQSSSGIPGLTINRLTTWSSLMLNVHIQVHPTTDPTTVTPVGANTFRGCLLQLDINTDPDVRELPGESVPSLWQELVELGSEIAEHGDIR